MYSSRTVNREVTFVQLNEPDKVAWDQLFDPSYDLRAHGWTAGMKIRDVVTSTTLELFTPGTEVVWGGASGVAGFLQALVPIVKNTLITLNAATEAVNVSGAGGVYTVVALNNAQPGQRVYIIALGAALVLAGATPPAPGDRVATDATGRTKLPSAGEYTSGTCVSPPINVGGVDYQIVTLAGGGSTVAVPPVPPTGPITTVFSTSGSYVVPPGITSITAYGAPGSGGGSGGGGGGGGFGGGVSGGGGAGGRGAGGGGGAIPVQAVLTVTPGQTITVVVGAGGVGATGGPGGAAAVAGTQGNTATNGSNSSLYLGASQLVTWGQNLVAGVSVGGLGSSRGGGGAAGTALAGGAGSSSLGGLGAGYPQASAGSNGQTSPVTVAAGGPTGTAGGTPGANPGVAPVAWGSGSLYTPGGLGDPTLSGAGGAGAGGLRGGGSGGGAGGKGGLGREYAFAGGALPGLTTGQSGTGGAAGAANAAGAGGNGLPGTAGQSGSVGRGGGGGAGGGGGGAGSTVGGAGGAGGAGGNGTSGIVVIVA